MNTDGSVLTVDFDRLPKPFFGKHTAWAELADFAWRRAAAHVRQSRGRWHMDTAWDPKRNYQWVWDTVFMTLYCRYGNGQYPGIQSLDNFYELQRADGHIGMTYDMTTGEEPWPNRINPPLFAWAEWEHYRTTGDASRFARVLPRNFVSAKTVAGFWPLLAGICPPGRVAALVGHLRDPRLFNRPIPVPSLAADDVNYDPNGTYWTGGVWAPTNYMITRGLQTAGAGDEAHRIAVKYLDGLTRTYAARTPRTLWECYSPEHDRPGLAAYTGKSVKPDFVGWTGLGPIAMVIENIIGIDLDVPARKLTWDIRLTEAHGLEGLGVGDGRVSVRCARRTGRSAKACVELISDVDLAVEIRCDGRRRTSRIRPGKPLSLTV